MRASLRLVALAAFFLLASPLHAQTTPDRADARRVSTAVRALFETLREAVLHAPEPGLSDRLRPLAYSFAAFETDSAPAEPDELSRQVQRLLDDVLSLRDDLRAEGQPVTAGRLDPVVNGLRDLLASVREEERRQPQEQEWEEEEEESTEWSWDSRDESDADSAEHRQDRWRSFYGRRHFSVRIGEELFWSEGVVQQGLPVRYNRVEGLYLGLRRAPLELDAYRPARLFGEVGYAFALEKARYGVGLDVRVTPRGPYAAKVGGQYRRGTATEDTWKADPIENALAAFFARHDYYDYYETEGWTLYGEMQLGRVGRVQAGYRDEGHRALDNNATWALFGGEAFRLNPAADSGRTHSLAGTLELGRVRDFSGLPSGAAFRTDVELGQGLGGDFSFTRLVADGRLYVPATRQMSLHLRLRGGVATGADIPFQKGFTIGGVGSVRAYPQNVFYGTRMLVANAEVAMHQPGLLDDLLDNVQLFAFADAGWVNGAAASFQAHDAISSAGLGLGLDDRRVRLELAWPLRDEGFGLYPTLWLRLAPSF